MNRPINISLPYRATSPEDEAFNDIERMSKIKQEIISNPSKEAKLRIEVALLTECVRAMSDRITELENKCSNQS
jgi:hypothetical protein